MSAARYRCAICGRVFVLRHPEDPGPDAVPCRAIVAVTDILAGAALRCAGTAYRQETLP